MTNPYVADQMVTRPDMLFGRQVHLRRLLQRARDLDCAAVVGPPGIGKSSLLYQLSQQDALNNTHFSVYLNLSETTLQSPGAFAERVLQELGRAAGRPFAGSSLADLGQVLTSLRDQDRRYVLLCLDDFDQFALQAASANALLEALRELGFARLFSLVMASPYTLNELALRGTISHRFVRLFEEQVELSLLPARDAERLIREPAALQGVEFSAEAVALARELGGRHPLYLQLAAHTLFEWSLAAEETDLATVRERFAVVAFPHFHRLWAYLTAEEREAARYYAGISGVHPPGVAIRQAFIQKGLIERREGAYCLFSDHAAEVVRSQRQRLQEPLPVPETEPSVSEAEVGADVPEETTGPPALPPEESAPLPVEVAEVVEPEMPAGTSSLAIAEPEPDAAVTEYAEEAVSGRPASLAALGCYVLAISLDLLFVAGIVIARALVGLSSRDMYILIGLAAVFPVLVLFANRLAGGLWARVFDRLLPRE